MVTTDPYAARSAVARLVVDAHRFVEGEFGDPARPARTAEAREAFDCLLQIGCLSQALQERVDELEALGPAPTDERRRLMAAPCPVRFTGVTGVPAHVVSMPVERIVTTAWEHERVIRRLAGRALVAAGRLREQVTAWEALVTAAEAAGLGTGRPVLSEGVRAALDRLAKWEDTAEAAEEGLAATVAAAAEEVTRARQDLRQSCHSELAGRLQAYRQKAVDERLGEEPGLDAFYQAALRAMQPGGFDLAAASEAVLAYQRAVNGGTT
jgi:hypothetical protein